MTTGHKKSIRKELLREYKKENYNRRGGYGNETMPLRRFQGKGCFIKNEMINIGKLLSHTRKS